MKRFDWAELMRFAMVQLRLTPDQFWALTPAELALFAGPGQRNAMSRSGLAELIKQYPEPSKEKP